MRVSRWCLVLALLSTASLLAGCSGKSLDEMMIGRWVEEKSERTFELTEQHLFAIVGNGQQVETGVWKVDGDKVVLECYGGPRRGEIETWEPDMDGEDKFTVSQGEAFIRTFARVKSSEKIFDERLVGLWQTDTEFPEVVAFSSSGVLIGWAWRLPDKTGKGDPYTIGSWAKVTRGASDFFRLEGFAGNMPVYAGRGHAFRLDGGKLIWRKPSSRREDSYRKVNLADLEPSGTKKKNPGPKASQTPSQE